MARTFTKNVSNYMSLGNNAIGPLINGATRVAIHVWMKGASYTTVSSDNKILYVSIANATGPSMGIDNSGASPFLSVGSRSQSADSFQSKVGTTNIATGSFWALGALFDYTNKTIQPYVSGVAEAGGSVTFGSNTYVHSSNTTNDGIGAQFNGSAPLSTAAQLNGVIAEIAVWKFTSTDNLTTAEWAALGTQIVGARRVRPDALIAYFMLDGATSPEKDLINSLSGTITGSVPVAAHPQINYRVRPY